MQCKSSFTIFNPSLGNGKIHLRFHFVCVRMIFYIICTCWIHRYFIKFSKFCTFVMKLLVTSLVMCWLLFWNFWTIISICFFLKESFKDKIESMILFLRYYWNMPPPSSLKLCNKPPMVGKIYSYTYSLCAHACVVCNHRFCSSIQGEKKLIRDDLCILWNWRRFKPRILQAYKFLNV